jgi:decaprenylphospho-beta-D-erythro-pentofuranosid-2-ulose 2-reductase
MNDAFGRPASVFALGATSDIARALLERLVREGCERAILAGRDERKLEAVAAHLRDAGVGSVSTLTFDATEVEAAGSVVDAGFAADEQIDLVVVAVGLLCDQPEDERDPDRVAHCVAVNFTWPAAALARVAEHLSTQGSGRAVVFSSVAGVRVRRSNFVYGSAKAGLDSYARALNQTLVGTGAGITVVRPGFVVSKMTAGRTAPPLSTTPDAVAHDVVVGLERRADVVWSPRYLAALFAGLRLVPEPLWRRLPF